MAKKIALKKGVYESAKISASKGEFISAEDIESLSTHSYQEILKYLEEHGFKEVIDNSYLSYEGFYLIEKILNDYLSQNYAKFLRATSKENRKFLEIYYLKYQIHNVMATMRCKESSQEELIPYLIGDERRKEKYHKAFEMSKEEALRYLAKKLKFDTNEVLEYYNKGLFELENYLYKEYYTKLVSTKPQYAKPEDSKYQKFIRRYVDLLNGRSYVALFEDYQSHFEELFIPGGFISMDFFMKESQNAIFKELSGVTKQKISKSIEIDKAVGAHKSRASELFTSVSFGSPYALLGYFFTLEHTISQIRKLLKAKYMNLSQEEINEVLQK